MKEISLYIHIPYCKQKCFYCDFPSYPCKEDTMKEYIDALIEEMKGVQGYLIKSVFIGGGTPSYLSEECLETLKNGILKYLNLKENCEFTIESNPGSLNRKKIKIFKEMRCNRVSLGLQAVQNNILKSIGRIHTFEEFKESVNLLREQEIDNINVDLMFGLPNQNLNDLVMSIEEVIKLNVSHISCYSLIIEEGTAFYVLNEKEKLKLPSEEEERKMYSTAIEVLRKNGYVQYEISNFCKHNKECKHNIVYWSMEEYIGLGVSASSYLNDTRYTNVKSIEEYIERIKKGEDVKDFVYKNTLNDNIEEFMFMGLRKINGIRKDDFLQKFGVDINEFYGHIINKYKQFFIENDERLCLNSRGIEISNTIMSEFILD